MFYIQGILSMLQTHERLIKCKVYISVIVFQLRKGSSNVKFISTIIDHYNCMRQLIKDLFQ